jgi:hypothetical protein
MMNLKLKRLDFREDCTLGVLMVNGTPWYFTVERPWLNNTPFVSCIPGGTYPIKWVDTKTSGNRNGRGIGIEDVPDRTLIRVHVANYASQVAGCAGVGFKRYDFPHARGVSESSGALNHLMDRFPDGQEGLIHISHL